MPGRYEMVDEPTLDSELGDEVYNPDQSVAAVGRRPQIRSLEPIVAGPVSLKTIFLDPRWSESQRRACLGSLGCAAVSGLVLLVLLLVGLARVLSHISWMEEMEKHGLALSPDLFAMLFTSFLYSPTKYRWGSTFTSEINKTLWSYQPSNVPSDFYQDCGEDGKPAEGKHCAFPLSTVLQDECTPEKNFGYEDGRPCLLFRFKHEQGWMPTDSRDKPLRWLPLSCRAARNGQIEVALNYTTYPARGFDTRFFEKGPGLGPDEELFSPEPLVMVQLRNLADLFEDLPGLPIQIRCRLGSSKEKKLRPDGFYGVRVIEFDVRLASDFFG